MGLEVKQIRTMGGGSKSDVWNQIKADMLNADVVRYRTSGGAVVTNCVFAALAAGHITDVQAALEKTIVRDAEYQPNAENTATYRRLFELKTKLVKTDLQAAYQTLADMRSK